MGRLTDRRGRGVSLAIGIHDGVRAADYHSDPCDGPSLSSSIAKVLIDATPRHAWTKHPRLNPDFEASDDSKFDLGKTAHEIILGAGGGFVVVDAADWRTNAAKEQRESAISRGATPILRKQANDAGFMAGRVAGRLIEIPECKGLFPADWKSAAPSPFVNGRGERVGIWRDIGGALCRMMIDWQGPTETEIWDVKTTGVKLNDHSIQSLILNMGYDLSAGFYLRGLSHLLPKLAGRFRWKWIFIEDSEPFEVRVIEPSAELLEVGDRKAALAIAKWDRCIAANEWPGYAPTVTRIENPEWSTARWNERELTDDDALNFRPLSRAGVQPPPEMMEPV